MDPNKVNLNNLQNLNNNIPNPYDPSTNNNINMVRNNINTEVKEPVKVNNPLEIQNDIFNQKTSETYGDNINQGDNYNVSYDSRNQNVKPGKKNLILKYIIFFGLIVLVGVIIYIVSTYVK